MTGFPKLGILDSTISLIRDPYRYISKHCDELNTDVFQARLLLQKTVCMRGEEAARIFYNTEYFSRTGVAPSRIKKTLFGEGGVQGLDEEEHFQRKKMFMSFLRADKIGKLSMITCDIWKSRVKDWSSKEKINLYQQSCELLTQSVCMWAGVPLKESEVSQRSEELTALFNYAGNIGPKHWKARIARKRNEAWLISIIESIREGTFRPSTNSAAYIVANHRDLDGCLLESQIAAVELNNLLRPTVAVAVYIVYCAHALHQNPLIKHRLVNGSDKDYECFVQEVRRLYPFFPFTAATVKRTFEWRGYKFPKGRRAFLDLFGTNHDARTWENPNNFDMERFRDCKLNDYVFIPQGGGDHFRNHRCPGEWVAIEQMKIATKILVSECDYTVPEQDLDLRMGSLPALPKSNFIISDVRPIDKDEDLNDHI